MLVVPKSKAQSFASISWHVFSPWQSLSKLSSAHYPLFDKLLKFRMWFKYGLKVQKLLALSGRVGLTCET